MGVLRHMHQPKLNRCHATERRAPGWTGTPALVLGMLGLLTGRPRNVQEFPGRWPMTPGGHRFSPACLTSLLSLGRVAAYCLAEAGHDPGKCVRPELIERGG